jgi:hypothetical protein
MAHTVERREFETGLIVIRANGSQRLEERKINRQLGLETLLK